jgi:hypothetical protein
MINHGNKTGSDSSAKDNGGGGDFKLIADQPIPNACKT